LTARLIAEDIVAGKQLAENFVKYGREEGRETGF
jgi:hypothetical protein